MHYTMKRGGAYDRFRIMLDAFLERGCEVHCLSLTPIPVNHPSYHNHVITFPFGTGNRFVARLVTLLLFPLYGLIMGWREKIDLCVAFGPLYAFLQSVPRLILGKPMVTLIRVDLSLSSKGWAWRNPRTLIDQAMEYVALLFSDRIITTNTTIREEILRISQKWKKIEVEVLYNNIPPVRKSGANDVSRVRAEFGIPEQGRMMVTGGVMTPRKNFETLIRSLSGLGRQDVFLVISGDSSSGGGDHYCRFLKDLIRKLDLGNKVILTGWVEKEELWRIFSAADLFVLPSLKEGMPNVLLEALGCNIPCFGSNIPGIRDILSHDFLMFDPHDDEVLAKKLAHFFSDEDYRKKIAHLCFGQTEKFRFDWKERVFAAVTR